MPPCEHKMHRGTRKANTMLQASPSRLPSLPIVYVLTAIDDPQMENNLHLLTRPNDMQTHAHACSFGFTVVVFLWPLSNGNHMMDRIQLRKTVENLHPEKKTSTNKVSRKKRKKAGFQRQSFQGIWYQHFSKDG